MKNVLKGLSLGLVGLVAITGTTSNASAQDDLGEIGVFDDLSELEGIEHGVSRSYSIDFENMNPMDFIDDEGNINFGSDPLLFGASVMLFDSDDNAEQAIEDAADSADDELNATEGVVFEEFDVDDLGDNAIGFTGVASEDEMMGTTYATALVVQEDEYLYFIFSVGIGEEYDGEAFATGLAEEMLDAEAGDPDDAEFSEDGTSEGGLWDKLPAAADYEDLVVTDTISYPVEDATVTTEEDDDDEEEEEAA